MMYKLYVTMSQGNERAHQEPPEEHHVHKPVLIDLYCCAGGATRGYQQVGFYVVGVDIEPRPNYCGDQFIEMDAIKFLTDMAARNGIPTFYGLTDSAVAIHASCPCQKGCTLRRGTNDARGWGRQDHVQLVPPTRRLLNAIGLPYVIEQPQGHDGLIRTDVRLCMDEFYPADFPPPWVQRHRDFEISGFTVAQPKHIKHRGYVRGLRHGVWRSGPDAPYVAAYGDGGGKATVPEMQHALGIDWTDVREELTEAIPPAYTQFIGEQLMAHLNARAPQMAA